LDDALVDEADGDSGEKVERARDLYAQKKSKQFEFITHLQTRLHRFSAMKIMEGFADSKRLRSLTAFVPIFIGS